MQKKVFVTGASGFIGSNLVKALRSENYAVTVLLRQTALVPEFEKLGAKVIIGSLEDTELLVGALKDQDIIIHAASMVYRTDIPLEEFRKLNVDITHTILTSAPLSLERFVYISTVHVHGLHHEHASLPITESSPTRPSSDYAKSKLEAEEIVRQAALPYVIIRPTIVYGPGDRYGFVHNLTTLIEGKKFLPFPGSGRNHVHLVYIDDLVTGILQAVHARAALNQTYILGGKESISTKVLLKNISHATGTRVFIFHIPLWLVDLLSTLLNVFGDLIGKGDLVSRGRILTVAGHRRFSIDKAQTELDYHPKIDYTDGLKKTMNARHPEIPAPVLHKAAQKYETPFFIFSEEILRHRLKLIRDSFSRYYKPLKIYYSAKTNYNHWVLTKLREAGSDIEIACGQELVAAKRAGFKGEQICFDGAVKTDEDIELAIKEGINYFNFDSLEDARNVSRVASRMNATVRGGFRIDIKFKGILRGPAETYIRKFGVPLEDAVSAYQTARDLPGITLDVISCHIGSQIITIKPYTATIKRLVQLACDLEQVGFTIHEINIGGGYPSATLTKTTPLRFLLSFFKIDYREKIPSLREFGESISNVFAEETKRLKVKPVLAIEPGRSVTSPIGVLVNRAKVKKKNNWVLLDGSKYFIPESAFFVHHEIKKVPKDGETLPTTNLERYYIAGASLNTADIFASNIKMPPIEKGDLVTIHDAGAYSISRAVPFTILLPPVYALELSGDLTLIRKKGTYEDALDSDVSR